jgi:hypothetical protein
MEVFHLEAAGHPLQKTKLDLMALYMQKVYMQSPLHSPDITQIPAMVAESLTMNCIGESLSCVTCTLRALMSYLKNIPGIP